jgi:hypothetical protein
MLQATHNDGGVNTKGRGETTNIGFGFESSQLGGALRGNESN